MKKHNLVLDIDSTLLYTLDKFSGLKAMIERNESYDYLKNRTYSIQLHDPDSNGSSKPYTMWGIYRPYLKEFIEFSIEHFRNIYIWSAGCDKYVHTMVDYIFGPYGYVPKIIFTKKHCSIDSKNGIVHKPLRLMYEESHGEADETNTFVIDDRDDTFHENEGNAIHIPCYELPELGSKPGKDDVDEFIKEVLRKDDELARLIKFFRNNSSEDDIRRLDKSSIFSYVPEKYFVSDDKTCQPDKSTSPSHNIHF